VERSDKLLRQAKKLYLEFKEGEGNTFLTTTFAKAIKSWKDELSDTDKEVDELILDFGLEKICSQTN
jgi:hypothetical protein